MISDSAVPQQARDAEGRYSNFFKIGYNAFEFLLDFGQVYQEGGADSVHTRIVTTPRYAKALSELLIETLADYVKTYGQIPNVLDEEPATECEQPS